MFVLSDEVQNVLWQNESSKISGPYGGSHQPQNNIKSCRLWSNEAPENRHVALECSVCVCCLVHICLSHIQPSFVGILFHLSLGMITDMMQAQLSWIGTTINLNHNQGLVATYSRHVSSHDANTDTDQVLEGRLNSLATMASLPPWLVGPCQLLPEAPSFHEAFFGGPLK